MSLFWRGVLAIIFGLAAVIYSGLTLVVLVMLFGIFLLLNGLFTLIYAVSDKKHKPLILSGVISLVAGAIILIWPAITSIVLIVIVGIWAIVIGIIELVSCILSPLTLREGLWMEIYGLISIIFGIVFLCIPYAGVVAFGWLLGIFALIYGVSMVFMAFKLKQLPATLTGFYLRLLCMSVIPAKAGIHRQR